MSARHQLFLEFPETTNKGVFRIEDSSIYTNTLPIQCPTLEITPPGYTSQTIVNLSGSEFKLFLNACNVGILNEGCGSICPDLPDGIWNIRYSVAPNDKVYVEYQVLRYVGIMKEWEKALCWINSKPADPTIETITAIRELQLIESQLRTAKYFVEDIHDQATGMEILLFARKKLTDFMKGCQLC